MSSEVAVIGGGITGLTAALRLAEAGRAVVLVDQSSIGSGTTGHSTAKVTSQHGITYAPLLGSHGPEAIQTYGRANEEAKETIAGLGGSRIDCDFRRRDAWVYAAGEADRELIEAEARAAKRAGLPARIDDDVPLPFSTSGGLVFTDQAEFDPQRYILGVAQLSRKRAARSMKTPARPASATVRPLAFARSTARSPPTMSWSATLIPFLDRGGFFARAFATRSYCVTAAVSGPAPAAMLITARPPMRSIRCGRHAAIASC